MFCFFILLVSPVRAEIILDSQNGYTPPQGKILLMVGQDKSTIDRYVNALGIVPAGVMVYTSIQAVSGLWEPFDNGAGVHYAQYLLEKYPRCVLQIGLYMVGALDGVNEGKFDQNIGKLADWIKGVNRPVYLRIGYEFDNKQNHYAPLSYRNAFRHIVYQFRSRSVRNVAFVWHSGCYENSNDPMKWYPGDDYVDWFAVSFFDPFQYGKIKEFAAQALAKGKPLMIAESTPAGTVSERAKLDWFKKYFRVIDEVLAKAVCYINSDWESFPMHRGQGYGDARIQKFPKVKKLWLEQMQRGKFVQANQLSNSYLTGEQP